MFIRLTVLLLIVSNYSAGQIPGKRSPTKFEQFINSKNIQWAAYLNDTLQFENYKLNDELYKRFQKNEIKITFPISKDSLRSGNKISYMNKGQLDILSLSPGNGAVVTNKVDKNSSFANTAQILYVADGKLFSYVPWITTEISIYTTSGRFIAPSEYFSSCINYKYNFAPAKRDKLVYIQTTRNKIDLTNFPTKNMLKQLYGQNLLEAIWNDLVNEKNELIDLATGRQRSFTEQENFSFLHYVTVPLYDSTGNIMGTRSINEPLQPSLFQKLEITQDWYYDITRNIVINNIENITLYCRMDPYNERVELKPVLKILFK